tara:strand:+ start:317 stop:916 length:600 start_codon:yes stop_codon:yes gene_type:complete
MNIHVNTDPFPFLIIEDLYTEDELTLIWQELDYYQSNSYILNANTNPSLSEDGKARTKKQGNFVDNVFQKREYSNILCLSRKLFQPGLIVNSDHIKEWKYLRPDIDHSLLSYYDDGAYYLPHHDNTVVSIISWLWKEPKRFEGGDFVFEDYKLTIKCKHNSAVAFPGTTLHGVTPITMEDQYKDEGLGRYSLSHFLNFV